MPPFRVLNDFLDDVIVQDLFAFALSQQAEFRPTGIGRDKEKTIDTAFRVSLGLSDLGAYRGILETKILALVPRLIEELRVTPFEPSRSEFQLVAHGDGAFYKRHIDTQTASNRKQRRVLTCVYYFYREPKAFSGGVLRLYAIGDIMRFVDIEPIRNSLLVFPSWAPHEVMTVACPAGRFIDLRFAINCWLRTKKPNVSHEPS